MFSFYFYDDQSFDFLFRNLAGYSVFLVPFEKSVFFVTVFSLLSVVLPSLFLIIHPIYSTTLNVGGAKGFSFRCGSKVLPVRIYINTYRDFIHFFFIDCAFCN